jgi:hypothetical protein
MSSETVKSRVSPRNTELQNCSQLDSWWMSCTALCFECRCLLLSSYSHLILPTCPFLKLITQNTSFSIRPVQGLNLNRRSSSGLESEWPIRAGKIDLVQRVNQEDYEHNASLCNMLFVRVWGFCYCYDTRENRSMVSAIKEMGMAVLKIKPWFLELGKINKRVPPFKNSFKLLCSFVHRLTFIKL